jgi:hypothetical protein
MDGISKEASQTRVYRVAKNVTHSARFACSGQAPSRGSPDPSAGKKRLPWDDSKDDNKTVA